MQRVIFQPAANKLAKSHIERTVKNPIDLNSIKQFIDTDTFNQLLTIYPTNKCYLWGITQGKSNKKITTWRNIAMGDIILFAANNKIFAKAIATVKLHSVPLAKFLWGLDDNGDTWEYIYFIDEITNQSIDYADVNKTIGYDINHTIQGFQMLNEKQSMNLLIKFDWFTAICEREVSKDEFITAIEKLDQENDLDNEIRSTARKEQSFLRQYLFGKHLTYRCALCGKEYPIDMLITSHIKKRAECTKSEKLDYKNIVIPMCNCGCDDLYEKGYIFVNENGIIEKNKSKTTTSDLDEKILQITGRKCLYFKTNNAKYFKAHREKLISNKLS